MGKNERSTGKALCTKQEIKVKRLAFEYREPVENLNCTVDLK